MAVSSATLYGIVASRGPDRFEQKFITITTYCHSASLVILDFVYRMFFFFAQAVHNAVYVRLSGVFSIFLSPLPTSLHTHHHHPNFFRAVTL